MKDYEKYELSIRIKDDKDIVKARRLVKGFLLDNNFRLTDTTKVATAVSELARNIVRYAGEGLIMIGFGEEEGREYVEILAHDEGPGIKDLDNALKEGFTTSSTSFGMGLNVARRLMDDFKIKSSENGTDVVVKKYKTVLWR